MVEAYDNGDPSALVEALGEYIEVWRHWDELQAMLGHPGGAALVADRWGLLLVEPEENHG